MFWFQLIVVLLVLGGIAWVAAGRGGELAEAHSDRPDLALPTDRPLSKPAIDGLRFNLGLRGYRMAEVDDVLDRLAAEIAERDARIAELTAAPNAVSMASTPSDAGERSDEAGEATSSPAADA